MPRRSSSRNNPGPPPIARRNHDENGGKSNTIPMFRYLKNLQNNHNENKFDNNNEKNDTVHDQRLLDQQQDCPDQRQNIIQNLDNDHMNEARSDKAAKNRLYCQQWRLDRKNEFASLVCDKERLERENKQLENHLQQVVAENMMLKSLLNDSQDHG